MLLCGDKDGVRRRWSTALLTSGRRRARWTFLRELVLAISIASSCLPANGGQQPGRSMDDDATRQMQCRDAFCEGDLLPRYDPNVQVPFKVGGQIFLAPKQYGGAGGVMAFFWPSRTPANQPGAEKFAPEFVPSARGTVSNFPGVAIEIFLRSNYIPEPPRGYERIRQAEREKRVIRHVVLRPGLDVVEVEDSPLGRATYYVATELRNPEGQPPVARCDPVGHGSRGGSGFMWRPGIWVGVRMNPRHCTDWPEIYQEVLRVLSLVQAKGIDP